MAFKPRVWVIKPSMRRILILFKFYLLRKTIWIYYGTNFKDVAQVFRGGSMDPQGISDQLNLFRRARIIIGLHFDSKLCWIQIFLRHFNIYFSSQEAFCRPWK
jgi:hypothetical protein